MQTIVEIRRANMQGHQGRAFVSFCCPEGTTETMIFSIFRDYFNDPENLQEFCKNAEIKETPHD